MHFSKNIVFPSSSTCSVLDRALAPLGHNLWSGLLQLCRRDPFVFVGRKSLKMDQESRTIACTLLIHDCVNLVLIVTNFFFSFSWTRLIKRYKMREMTLQN